jgi:putative endopeptidase
MRRIVFACLAIALACPAFRSFAQTQTAPQPAAEQTFKLVPGFDPAAMNTSADPCSDFYQYACGNYAGLHPLPADLPEMDQFTGLYEYNLQMLRGLVETAAAAHAAAGSDEQKIGDSYQSCVDTDAIDKKGLAPLQPILDRIAALKTKEELPALTAALNKMGVGVFFDFGSQQDFKDATREIAYADQSGLGLPEKDYYLRTDEKSVEIRKQYVTHLANMLKLLGGAPETAQSEAQKIMEFETALAKASMGNVERRDPENIYHMMPLATLAASAPLLDVPKYIEAIGAPPVHELNVTTLDFCKGLNAAVGQTSMGTIQAYLRVHLADAFSAGLPRAFDDEYFDFYRRKRTGTPQQQARWKRCVNGVDGSIGEALGRLYVAQHFTPEMKAKTVQMVHDIEAAMGQDLDRLDWMSPETKVKAKEKLHAVADKIGYPNKWRDYSKLDIEAGDALGNEIRSREFETAYQLNKIGKPIDRGEWAMTPPTINAYYDDSMNDINFPAGILQPPFYDTSASDATNYGHIGAIVGHELTHGFDDEGAKFDAKGNLHDWWTEADKKQFGEKTDCLANEYSQFTAIDDVKVNGKLTLGENTADNGGLRLALIAMLARAAEPGNQQKTIGTFEVGSNSTTIKAYSPEQQFFLGYAQNYCTNDRPEYLRMLANIDPHSPDAVRVKGALVNMPEFAHAFNCKAGQPMAPVKSCRVW